MSGGKRTLFACTALLVILINPASSLDTTADWIPKGIVEGRRAEWISAFRVALGRSDARVFPRAQALAARYLADSRFPDDPELAAALYVRVSEDADLALRRGDPPGLIGQKLKNEWKLLLEKHDSGRKVPKNIAGNDRGATASDRANKRGQGPLKIGKTGSPGKSNPGGKSGPDGKPGSHGKSGYGPGETSVDNNGNVSR